MSDRSTVDVFVKLQHWEAYTSAVFVTARVYRKVLYIWGVVLAIFITTLLYAWVRPASDREWLEIYRNSKPLF